MKIVEFAMEKETAARKHYEQLAECAINPGLRKIFNMLADEERKHCEVVQNLKQHSGMGKETDVLRNATDFLMKTFESNKEFLCDAETLEAYRHAVSMEEESIRLYEDAYAKAEDPGEKEAFRILSEQERRHKLLVENIIEFVENPERTLEDAEFARYDPEF